LYIGLLSLPGELSPLHVEQFQQGEIVFVLSHVVVDLQQSRRSTLRDDQDNTASWAEDLASHE